MDENATRHHARVIKAYKQANSNITEDWPVCSPDLNMTKHAWDMLKRLVNVWQQASNSLAGLSIAVQEERNNWDQNKLRWLVCSISSKQVL